MFDNHTFVTVSLSLQRNETVCIYAGLLHGSRLSWKATLKLGMAYVQMDYGLLSLALVLSSCCLRAKHWQNRGAELGYGSRPQVLEQTNQCGVLNVAPKEKKCEKKQLNKEDVNTLAKVQTRTLSSCEYSSKERTRTSVGTGLAFLPVC